MMNILRLFLFIFFIFLLNTDTFAETTWPTFNGDLKAQKYSPLTQITPQNVKNLKVAWSIHTGDYSHGKGTIPATAWSATPLFVNNTIYVSTPFYRIFALDPETGKAKWIFDSHSILKGLTQPDLKSRGVAYWQAEKIIPGLACQKRVYLGTMDAKLYSVDADTGKLCQDFGVNGILNVNQWNNHPEMWPLSLLQPPTVYKNILVLGWAGKDFASVVDPNGSVFALDARTGKLLWTFYPIPPHMVSKTGTANVWASMSVDTEKGIIYLPVSSPSPNMWGGLRLEPMPLVTSVTALDINTGKVIWSRQLVYHDLWDYDTNSAPTLIDLKKDGKIIPALVQTTKQGFLFVLNRYTGEPIYPIVDKPAPASNAIGEVASKIQPTVPYPLPVNGDEWPGVFKLADWTSFGYCSKKFAKLRYEGRFTPPSTQGTLVYPFSDGGVEWGGGAFDPNKQIFVVNSSAGIEIYKLIPRAQYNRLVKKYGNKLNPNDYFPMTGAPYGFEKTVFLNPFGMPCWNPPFGYISAYALDTGKLLWRKPFGQIQRYGFYMPKSWGSPTIGGPVITASGLIFIGGSMDSRVRAYDVKTGNELWKANVFAPAYSIPAVFEYKHKQYVVFTAGGNPFVGRKVGDQIIAFTLP